MSTIGYGHGSEWHLLRYLGYHRHELNKNIEAKTEGRMLDWLDVRMSSTSKFHYAEWTGLDFLATGLDVKEEWKKFWPQSGGVQNWDAVGWMQREDHTTDLVLVEAKGHKNELKSNCGAKNSGRQMIQSALAQTKSAMGIDPAIDWMKGYYQFCNRLAVLHFLMTHNISTRLVFIYFCGDDVTHGQPCCKDSSEWRDALKHMHKAVGFDFNNRYGDRIHEVFLDIYPKP